MFCRELLARLARIIQLRVPVPGQYVYPFSTGRFAYWGSDISAYGFGESLV